MTACRAGGPGGERGHRRGDLRPVSSAAPAGV